MLLVAASLSFFSNQLNKVWLFLRDIFSSRTLKPELIFTKLANNYYLHQIKVSNVYSTTFSKTTFSFYIIPYFMI